MRIKYIAVSLIAALNLFFTACTGEILYVKIDYGVIPGTQQDGYGIAKFQDFYIFNESGYGAPFEDVTFTIDFFFADTTKQTEKIYWANWDGTARKIETRIRSFNVEKCEIKGYAIDSIKNKRPFSNTWKKK